MKRQLQQLRDFHTKAKAIPIDSPTVDVSPQVKEVRIRLMQEELAEVIEAIKNEPIDQLAKELADLLYVVYGTVDAFGLSAKMEEIFEAVHVSNMSKFPADGKVLYNEYGKVIKPDTYRPPNIKQFFE